MIKLISLPRYRLQCDRVACGRVYEPTDPAIYGEPDRVREYGQRRGWRVLDGGVEVCPDHAPPARSATRVALWEQYAAVEPADEWRRDTWGGRCRQMSGRHRCGRPGLVEQRKPHGTSFRWWAWCGAHSGGRWLSAGKVYRWAERLRFEK